MSSKAFFVATVLPVLALVAVACALAGGARGPAGSRWRPAWGAAAAQAATPGPAATPAAGASPRQAEAKPQLYTRGRHVYTAPGRRFRPRGADLLQVAACDVPEARPDLLRLRAAADRLLAQGINLVRIPLEPWTDAGAWTYAEDLQELRALVDHVTAHPGAAVLLGASAPTGAAAGTGDLPRQRAFWRQVVALFADCPMVIFDLSRSQQAGDWAPDAAVVVHNTNALLEEIRAAERAAQVPSHLVAVQGDAPGKNGRSRDYYQGAALPAAKAGNVVWVGQRPDYLFRRPGALFVSPVR